MLGSMPVWEGLILLIVVGATLSIGLTPSQGEVKDLEISEISGTMVLSSRASMDAFGLQDFQIGPLATIDLAVHPIVSLDCLECEDDPTGFHITGAVVITQLVDDAGRLGRVEGTLDATYMREVSDSHHVVREWFSIDWDAGPASSHLVVMLHHSPAKWLPSEVHSSTFLETAFGYESRSGPYVSVSSLNDEIREIEGCLPGGFTCSKATERDYFLEAKLSEPRQPTPRPSPPMWQVVNSTPTTQDTPEGLEGLRSILSLDHTTPPSQAWTPDALGELTSIEAWNINASSSPNFAPVTSLFQSIGLPSIVFEVPEGTWNEADFDSHKTGFILDDEQNLVLAIQQLPS